MNDTLKWVLIGVGAYLIYNEYVAAPAAVAAPVTNTGAAPPAPGTATPPAQVIAQTTLNTLSQPSIASAVQNAAATANPGVTSLTPSQWNWYLNQVTGIPGPGLSNYGLPTETPVIFSTYWTAVMLWAQAAAQSPTGNAGMLAGLSQQSTRTFDMQEAAW